MKGRWLPALAGFCLGLLHAGLFLGGYPELAWLIDLASWLWAPKGRW